MKFLQFEHPAQHVHNYVIIIGNIGTHLHTPGPGPGDSVHKQKIPGFGGMLLGGNGKTRFGLNSYY